MSTSICYSLKRNRHFVVIIVIISSIILAGLLFSLRTAYSRFPNFVNYKTVPYLHDILLSENPGNQDKLIAGTESNNSTSPMTGNAISSNNNNNINNNASNNKVVILTFDDNPKNQYTIAKPILDKYGFKATFFVICNLVGSDNVFEMNWQEVAALYKQGYDIESHTMNHKDLAKLSSQALEFEIGQSKQCLLDHSINATIFAYPYAEGDRNATVVNTVAKYYYLARTAGFSLMYLHCNGWDKGLLLYYNKSSQTDCRMYSNDGDLTYANRYDIRSWPHDDVAIRDSFNDTMVFKNFAELVNSQTDFNKDGTINAIPIVTYHNIDYSEGEPYHTNVGLFSKEMKYLHDNGFKVLPMNDLVYDENSKYLYIKTHPTLNPTPGSSISNTSSSPASFIVLLASPIIAGITGSIYFLILRKRTTKQHI